MKYDETGLPDIPPEKDREIRRTALKMRVVGGTIVLLPVLVAYDFVRAWVRQGAPTDVGNMVSLLAVGVLIGWAVLAATLHVNHYARVARYYARKTAALEQEIARGRQITPQRS